MFLVVIALAATVHLPGDSARARRLLEGASEREAMLDERGYAMLVRQALEADPRYVPAQRKMLQLLRVTVPTKQRLAVLAGVAGMTSSDSACLALQTSYVSGNQAATVAALRGAERRFGASKCLTYAVAELAGDGPQTAASVERNWRPVLAQNPRDEAVWHQYGAALLSAGDVPGAERAYTASSAHAASWEEDFDARAALMSLYEYRNDTAAVRRVRDALAQWAARDGRPGLRFRLEILECCDARPPRDGWQAAVRLAEAHGAPSHLAALYESLGSAEIDGGHPARAVWYLRRAAAIADSMRQDPTREQIYARLGRARAKSGDWPGAIAALQHALTVADTADTYFLAEIHHNLAHAYEGAGRLPEAMAEVDRFVALTSRLGGDAISVISLYDAGVIHWEAHRQTAARAAFDSMVHVIDARQNNYYYAGEYYERIGDLARALHYYRAVSAWDTEEGARALTGRVRVYESLGMSDSAAMAARLHDQTVQTPEEVRLQPRLLLRQGRSGEALRVARAWADTLTARGNLRGAAVAHLEVASLMSHVLSPAAVLAQARVAEAVARRGRSTDIVIRAQSLAAEALLRMQRLDAAVATADSAARRADRSGSADTRLLAQQTRGAVLAAQGRTQSALAAFDIAGRLVDSMSQSFAGDLDQSRLRSHELAPFDRAVALLLRSSPTPSAADALVFWSQRRKAAALPHTQTAARTPLSTTTVRMRLGRDRALIDYILLDSAAAAIVITRAGARVVRLPATADQVTRLVAAVRHPWTDAYMGRVDLARAELDTAATRALARAVVDPLLPLVRGYASLTIVPDGALHLLPFDLLPAGGDTLVIDRFTVSLLPSMQFVPLRHDLAITPARARLLLVGGDAPGVVDEVNALQRLWRRGTATVLWTSTMSAASVRQALPKNDVLHFATHAVADARDPLAARLVLRTADARGGADVLSLADIEAMRLHAQLVVLDACDTQDGELLPGVGPMGLARAFLVSGTQAVIATQWPVGASAAELMKVFYARVATGEPSDAALRSAKRQLRGQPRTKSPFDWAGFVLIGAD